MAMFHAGYTVLLFIAFIGIVLWAYSGSRKHDFDQAANLPFADDETPAQTDDSEARS